jgi:hypothetical protein
MVYSKTFSRPSYPPRRVASLRACPAAPAAARPTDDGLVEGEIAAFDGFWQGRTVAAMRTKAGEIGASPDNGDFVGIKTYPSHGICANS